MILSETPKNLLESEYKELRSLKKMFYDNGFGRIDIQRYFNLMKSYIDPSLFINIEKLIPARTRLMSGLLIEPSILERPKLTPTKIKGSGFVEDKVKAHDITTTKILNINFSGYKKQTNIASFGNQREDFKKYIDTDFAVIHEANIKFKKDKNEPTYDYNYGGSFVSDTLEPNMHNLFAMYGTWKYKDKLYKVEKIKRNLKKQVSLMER